MRIIFMGTPEFAVASLDKLVRSNFSIVAVVTAPDRPAGRGQQLHQSAVKEYALAKGLKVLQPERLKDPGFVEELRELRADVQFVVAFRMLPEMVWNMPPMGTFNLHASLLPKYRGAAPINWAIINGERQSGVTTFRLKHEVDTGEIFMQQKVNIGSDMTAGELHDLLKNAGAALLHKTAVAIEAALRENRQLVFTPQDDSLSSHAPKIFRDTCRIDWTGTATNIFNLVRGLCPHPAAFTTLSTKEGKQQLQVKIFRTVVEKAAANGKPGSIITDNKTFVKVHCGAGSLDLREIQLEGKKRMPVADFLRGFVLSETDHFL